MQKTITTFIVTLILAVPTFAQTVRLSVDIPNADALFSKQLKTNWCWAACNQMMLNAAGIPQTQEDQVLKMFGALVNMGAGPNYDRAAPVLYGQYKKANGTPVTVVPYVSYLAKRNPTDPIVIIQKLKSGIPVAMATPAHGFVCVGVDYEMTTTPYYTTYQITTLRLLDPAHGLFPVPKRRTVTMDQFLRAGLIGFMTFEVKE